MPYTKVRNHTDCKADQVAVVKKDDGKLMGCHDSEEAANRQIAALMAQEEEQHADREALRKAAKARAGKYGIAVKEKGHLTPPAGYPKEESAYGDPVNFKYPADASHAKAALGYFNHEGQREKGGYTSSEWAIIGRRLASRIGKHLGRQYQYKGGKLVPTEAGSRWIDMYQADRVLAGEEVCILPLMEGGYYRWGVKRPPITGDVLRTLLDNYERREDIGGLTRNVPITVEHEEVQGKIGVVAGLSIRPDGLYGTLDLTQRGQQKLEDGEFDYLSPEIVWEFMDIGTGEEVGPVLVGLGVTNYPFFGEATSMYSDAAIASARERFNFIVPAEEGEDAIAEETISQAMRTVAMLASHGWTIEDADTGSGPILRELSAHSDAIALLAQASGFRRDMQRRVMEAVCITKKGGGGREYPRSAFLLAQGEPEEWRYRIKEYAHWWKDTTDGDTTTIGDVGDILVVARRTLQAAIKEAHANGDRETVEAHAGLLTAFGVDAPHVLSEQTQEGEAMSDNGNEGNERETFAAEDYHALQTQVDQLTTQVASRDAIIDRMQHESVVERFSREAESFLALGIKVEDYASHMAWLQSADPEGEHLAFFQEVLRTADTALSKSESFQERGTSGPEPEKDPFQRVLQAVKAKAEAAGIEAPEGSSEWGRLVTEVYHEQPELAETYRASVLEGGS